MEFYNKRLTRVEKNKNKNFSKIKVNNNKVNLFNRISVLVLVIRIINL
jgi:hypothetical protein